MASFSSDPLILFSAMTCRVYVQMHGMESWTQRNVGASSYLSYMWLDTKKRYGPWEDKWGLPQLSASDLRVILVYRLPIKGVFNESRYGLDIRTRFHMSACQRGQPF